MIGPVQLELWKPHTFRLRIFTVTMLLISRVRTVGNAITELIRADPHVAAWTLSTVIATAPVVLLSVGLIVVLLLRGIFLRFCSIMSMCIFLFLWFMFLIDMSIFLVKRILIVIFGIFVFLVKSTVDIYILVVLVVVLVVKMRNVVMRLLVQGFLVLVSLRCL